ncbi:MAG: type IX secretion system sortase PorU [Flavobacteriaceae bacterium]|jgi:hypothetical protein|nr:type IX secretion system sortase PorU [Flavobacteriaceae bacterium]
MKKFCLFFFFIFSIAMSAQNVSFSIEWNTDNKLYFGDYSVAVPNFKSDNFVYNDFSQTIYFSEKIRINGRVDEESIRIRSLNLVDILEEELGVLDKEIVPSNINAKIMNTNNKDFNQALITFSPIIKTETGYKKVTSVSFEYNIGNSSNHRSGNEAMSSSDYIGIRNSVLSTGEWYRFYVEKSGVYRVNRSFLQQLGLNTNVDPKKIKIYGNGGRMLPLANNSDYPIDLEEVAIQFVGEEDGTFDNEDYILFYAEGVDNWNAESFTNLNLYDNKSYYYVTASGSNGKRIQPMTQPEGSADMIINTYNESQFYEKDLVNIGRLGRKWFGEQFGIQSSQTFEFSLPNIQSTELVSITINAASDAANATSMAVSANGQNIGNIGFTAISSSSSLIFSDVSANYTTAASQNLTIQLTYNNSGNPSSRAYLNYININAISNLSGNTKQFKFHNNNTGTTIGIAEYQVSNASGISQVWDITDRFNVVATSNSGQNSISFKSELGQVRYFTTVVSTDYYTPLRESNSKVTNQNLKGTIFNGSNGQFQDIDYLIITPSFLNSEAERLANFHRNYNQYNVKVVHLETIYPEFSSGKQDIGAIRNFVKYVYWNASNETNRVKFLNLFGDASFDFKNRIPNNTNIVPIYHSLNSNSLSSSVISDDFFGMMDDNEGLMNSSIHDLDVAVGRMIVSDLVQAREMVDKIIEYHDSKSYGRWRNNFTLISDDVDESWEQIIQLQLDQLGNTIGSEKPFVNVLKIHSDSYIQEASAGGQRYPKVRQDIINAFEQGSLVFNFFGHGGEDVLAHERIFEKTDAQALNNRYKYPLFVTVTCEFTRFDNPYRPTAGEYTYWNPAGGAISLLTTTRRIDVTTGQNINTAFASQLYGYAPSSDSSISIAEALRRAKNGYHSQTLMVFYIGDPALKLAIPKPTIILTEVNGEPVSESEFVFNALSHVTLKGEVRNEAGNQILADYNGELAVQIFDKPINRATLGNDGTTNSSGQLIIMNFTTLGETIFRGNASVNSGLFEFSFVVPRDITIPVGSGRISFYAKRNQPLLEDQTGYNTDIQIGGINTEAVADNTGPRVRLYMNDETFVNGGITDENPIFLAFLEDENGINTASGIGHDIVAILDGDESNPYILNDYYETELDDYTKGKVRYPFRNLEKGLHTITFRAWDVYNNPVTAEIQFVVVGDESVALTNVLNYPNPFVNYTQFWFTHNRPFESLDVQVQIMTITGKIVKTINQSVSTEGFLSREITWDGRDDFGDKIGKGVYVYKLTVKSTSSNKKAEKIEKLVIL